jgi:hypothetical protein
MPRHARDFLCVCIGVVFGAPLIAPLGIAIWERHLRREGLWEWARR